MDAHARVLALDPRAYNPFHLLLADRSGAVVVWSDGEQLHEHPLAPRRALDHRAQLWRRGQSPASASRRASDHAGGWARTRTGHLALDPRGPPTAPCTRTRFQGRARLVSTPCACTRGRSTTAPAPRRLIPSSVVRAGRFASCTRQGRPCENDFVDYADAIISRSISSIRSLVTPSNVTTRASAIRSSLVGFGKPTPRELFLRPRTLGADAGSARAGRPGSPRAAARAERRRLVASRDRAGADRGRHSRSGRDPGPQSGGGVRGRRSGDRIGGAGRDLRAGRQPRQVGLPPGLGAIARMGRGHRHVAGRGHAASARRRPARIQGPRKRTTRRRQPGGAVPLHLRGSHTSMPTRRATPPPAGSRTSSQSSRRASSPPVFPASPCTRAASATTACSTASTRS